jgi:hypothetical protein
MYLPQNDVYEKKEKNQQNRYFLMRTKEEHEEIHILIN